MWRAFFIVIFSSLKLVLLEPIDGENDGVDSQFKISYSGYKLLKTNLTQDVLESLEKDYGAEIWRSSSPVDSTSDLLVAPQYLDEVENRIKQEGGELSVVINDLETAIQEESPPVEDDFGLRNSHGMDWTRYHRLEDIHSYLRYLALFNPTICQLINIGTSSENRELLVLKVSSKKGARAKPAIWVDAGIHAREWASPASVTYAIRELVENYDNHPELIDAVDWYFLPVANPDGYEYTHTGNRLWRKTRSKTSSIRCSGVDPNRNFGYKWGGAGTSDNACSEIYRGPNAFSEPETEAMKQFIERNSANMKVYLTFHTYGQYILIPWGYAKHSYPRDFDEMTKLAQTAASAMKDATGVSFNVGQSADVLYAAAGGSDDWAKSIGIPYSYTFELRDTGNHGFVLPPQYIDISGKETFAALRAIAKHLIP